jgi:hypothetical protein
MCSFRINAVPSDIGTVRSVSFFGNANTNCRPSFFTSAGTFTTRPLAGFLLIASSSTAISSVPCKTRYAVRTVDGPNRASRSAIQAAISEGLIVRSCRRPNTGSTCNRSDDSYLISEAGSTTREASHRSATSPNRTFPASGSMYSPRSRSVSIAFACRSAGPFVPNALVRSCPSGSTHPANHRLPCPHLAVRTRSVRPSDCFTPRVH